MLKRLLIVTLAVAGLWAGYWGIGWYGLTQSLPAWLAERRDDGWAADWAEVTVRGFPNRFDIEVTDVTLADPDTGWAWRAPFFQVLTLSYKPNHVIAVWPDTQTVQTPFETLTISGEALRASLVFEAGTDLRLDRSSGVFEAVSVVSDAGWQAGADKILLASEPAIGDPLKVKLGLDATGLMPSSTLVARLSEVDVLPERLDHVAATMVVTFDAPWDRHALEQRRPQPTAIDIEKMSAVWGSLELRVAGTLTVDAAGLPEGSVLVKATNWRDILAVGVASGAVPEGLAGAISAALEVVSGLAGHPETLDIPVSFKGGQTFAGPIPVGPAPVLQLR